MKRVDPAARPWLTGAALAAGLLCAAVVLIPVAESAGIGLASLGRLALRPGCHQIPERCLDLGAGVLPVCARCAGLYAGGLIGLLVPAIGGRRARPGWRWLAAAVLPSAVDFALGLVGLPDLPNWPRFALAVVPGLLLGLLLADAICSTVELNRRPPAAGGTV
ncbi:MAG: DUF2085 domain-containing protein [Thermoanaerobaculales bacterium]|nr:DUF2085 domain-containing protein [Thermoanaerobaculales bacterium]